MSILEVAAAVTEDIVRLRHVKAAGLFIMSTGFPSPGDDSTRTTDQCAVAEGDVEPRTPVSLCRTHSTTRLINLIAGRENLLLLQN
jgi:hypothetical protein